MAIPEENLLIAVFNRAVLDYLGAAGARADERKDAEEYLFSPECEHVGPFCIAAVASHQGVEPDDLRRKVRKAAVKGLGARWKKGHR